MNPTEPTVDLTYHALLVAWGDLAQEIGLVQRFQEVALHQKKYVHTPQSKVLEFLVATLAGHEHLKDISRSAHPLDQDQVLARAWGQEGWADYSGVSRTLKEMTFPEAREIVKGLEEVSQIFIDQEVNLALLAEKHLLYDGDLTGLAVSKSSKTYPGADFGHMDDQIRLGYQAAVVSLRSPTYGRLWLSVDHHPGNTVSAAVAQGMIEAAEARTGVRPWRRTDLLAQRLEAFRAYGRTLYQKLERRQQKVSRVQQELQQVQQQVEQWQSRVRELETAYQASQRAERPNSRLAQARKKLDALQKRLQRRERALAKAQHVVAWTEGLLSQQQKKEATLQERLQRFQQENATNLTPVPAIFRLDAGFGSYENLALLIEMGYEVYCKVQNRNVLRSLLRQVRQETHWAIVGQDAAMVAWANRKLESFCYPLDVALERFSGEDRVKYSALLHFGPQPVTEDLPAWFHFYNGRQTIEAGIKESKHVFQLHRLKVRAEAAIFLQEHFVLFAANFIRWANAWLTRPQASPEEELSVDRLSVKGLVQVAAHTSAEVVWNSEGKLLKFTGQSVFAGKTLKLHRFACQLPLPFGKSYDFGPV